jgi:hypothetical protein
VSEQPELDPLEGAVVLGFAGGLVLVLVAAARQSITAGLERFLEHGRCTVLACGGRATAPRERDA